jgi:hypothetical protein
MADYEIREDSSNKYWPFTVFNLTENQMVNDRFSTKEKAQKCIDQLNSASANVDEMMFAFYGSPESEHLLPVETPEPVAQPVETRDEIIIEGEQVVGSTITFEGQQWFVKHSEFYSAANAREDEEGGMGSLSVGWHSWLKKVQPNV